MGRPKLSLPLGNRTVIECIIRTLRSGGVDRVIVVIGPHVPELVSFAESAGAEVCQLAEPTLDMRATVEAGLRWAEERFPPPQPRDPWLLTPADHPVINAEIVRALFSRFELGDCSIVVPIHDGRRGHPTILAWKHVTGIRGLPAGEGINTYLRRHATETVELPANDPGVFADLDTPEDYERLRQLVESR
jgi:molybdenum cofactor cytidylyltransferase